MKELHYAGGDAVVSDELAVAITDYAQALAMKGASDVIDIPAVDRDGSVGTTRFLLGPASQMMAESCPDADGPGLDDAAIVSELRARTRVAKPTVAFAAGEDDSTPIPDFEL